MNDDEVKAEFLRRTGVADHPFSRTPDMCCAKDPAKHLGYGDLPWTLPSVKEMRELLDIEEQP
jgi:hypothetical protein